MKLSSLILVALGGGILAGALLHLSFPEMVYPLDHYLLNPIGKAFLRLIQFVVVPIVFCSLILGLTRVPDATQVGRYVLKLLTGYLITAILAVTLGMLMALILKPGLGQTALPLPVVSQSLNPPSILDWLITLIPVNPLEALSSGNLLQTIISAALVGMGIQLAGQKAASFVALVESIYVINEKILALILYVAPVGVFALITSLIATQGFEVLGKLLVYVLGLITAFALMTGIYGMILWILRARPGEFFRSFFPAIELAFGTASSNAALPIALHCAQEDYGMGTDIAGFAIPFGTALKHDGSAIYQSFNALFIAQVYHIPMTPSLLLAIALSTLLISFSAAGVPGSGLIIMTTVLSAAGLPVEGVILVAGVDRLTDGFKTAVNLLGNLTHAVVLQHLSPDSAHTGQPVRVQ